MFRNTFGLPFPTTQPFPGTRVIAPFGTLSVAPLNGAFEQCGKESHPLWKKARSGVHQTRVLTPGVCGGNTGCDLRRDCLRHATGCIHNDAMV